MELRAQSLVVDGALRANGTGSYHTGTGQQPADKGGGSGGSIYVVLNGGIFSGSGVIEAKGGLSLDAGRLGGGGRIALVGCFSKNFSNALTNTGTLYLNRCPVLPLQNDRSMDELTTLVATNTATDEDLTNVLTYSFLTAPAGATISSNGVIQWLTSEINGPSTNLFTTVASDNAKVPLFATNSFAVFVNEINLAPSITLPPNTNVNELVAFTATATASDPDIPLNPLTFALVSGPAGMTVSAAGVINWMPDESQGPGTNTVTIRVTDISPLAVNATSLSATGSFQIVVNEVNAAPVLAVLTNRFINELTLLTVTNTATDSDLPANAFTYALLQAPTNAVIDTNGVITWTPAEAQGPSTNTFTTVVTDTNATALINGQLSATNTFTVVVNEVNVAPILTLPASTNINEQVAFSANASATDVDLPTNALTFALVSGPTGLTVSPGGTINWIPAEDQGPGTHTVTIRVTDSSPLAINATSLSVTSNFQITVNEVNVGPVLDALSNRSVNPGQTLTFTATATDTDLPANTLVYSLVSPPAGAQISSAGLFTWRPAVAQANTTNSLQVRVQDNGAPVSNDVKSFTVVVNPLTPVVLKTLVPAGGQFRFAISGPGGPDYVVMRSGNLTNWTDVTTNLSPNLPFEFAQPIGASGTNHFYRVRLEP